MYHPYGTGSFSLGDCDGEVFVIGTPEEDKTSELLCRFKENEEQGELVNVWNLTCGQECVKNVLHLSIYGLPFIAVSCWMCQGITLQIMMNNFYEQDPMLNYSHTDSDQAAPNILCQGPGNTILASNSFPGRKEILQYRLGITMLKLERRIRIDDYEINNVHYLEADDFGQIVIIAKSYRSDHIISAHSMNSQGGRPVWRKRNVKIDGLLFEPRGLCSDPTDDHVLYVGDKNSKSLITIDAKTGSILKSALLWGVTHICDIKWSPIQPHIVVGHIIEGDLRFSYYSSLPFVTYSQKSKGVRVRKYKRQRISGPKFRKRHGSTIIETGLSKKNLYQYPLIYYNPTVPAVQSYPLNLSLS